MGHSTLLGWEDVLIPWTLAELPNCGYWASIAQTASSSLQYGSACCGRQVMKENAAHGLSDLLLEIQKAPASALCPRTEQDLCGDYSPEGDVLSVLVLFLLNFCFRVVVTRWGMQSSFVHCWKYNRGRTGAHLS